LNGAANTAYDFFVGLGRGGIIVRFLRVIGIAAVLALGAQADVVLYDNIDGVPSTATATLISAGNPLYNSFSTGLFAGDLSSVSVLLGPAGGLDPTETITVSLYDDNSGSPASSGTSLGTINVTTPLSGPQEFTVNPLGITLAGNTQYWISLSTTASSSDVGWQVASTTGGMTVAGAPGIANDYNGAGSPPTIYQNST
jgi:hypothetical protein